MSYDPSQAPQPQWDAQQGRWVLPEQGNPQYRGQPSHGQESGYGQSEGQYGQTAPGGTDGPVYPGQPQYVPQPPPQPKRRKWPWIVAGFVLLLVIISVAGGGGDTTSPTTGAPAPTAAPPESTLEAPSSVAPSSEATSTGEVVYEVGGSGRATSISYGSGGGISQANGESLPWTETAQATEGFGVYSLTAQSNGTGEITCRITVDGEEIAQQRSTGQFAVVSCAGNTSPF